LTVTAICLVVFVKRVCVHVISCDVDAEKSNKLVNNDVVYVTSMHIE